MASKICKLSSSTWWALLGGSSVAVVVLIGLVLGLTLSRGTRPGRSLLLGHPPWLPLPSSHFKTLNPLLLVVLSPSYFHPTRQGSIHPLHPQPCQTSPRQATPIVSPLTSFWGLQSFACCLDGPPESSGLTGNPLSQQRAESTSFTLSG